MEKLDLASETAKSAYSRWECDWLKVTAGCDDLNDWLCGEEGGALALDRPDLRQRVSCVWTPLIEAEWNHFIDVLSAADSEPEEIRLRKVRDAWMTLDARRLALSFRLPGVLAEVLQ